MERRKLKITLSLAVLIPCVLYIAGIIAQFMININAWKAAGSDYSVSPGLPSLELADVFRSIFHFPEGLIAIGVVVVGIVLICILDSGSDGAKTESPTPIETLLSQTLAAMAQQVSCHRRRQVTALM